MASVGGMLAIPVSGLVDFIGHGDSFTPLGMRCHHLSLSL
jgi:hypothetical protein